MESQILKNLSVNNIIDSVSKNVESDNYISRVAMLFDELLFQDEITFRQFVEKIANFYDLEKELWHFYDYNTFSSKDIVEIYELLLSKNRISDTEAEEIRFVFTEFNYYLKIVELKIFDENQLKQTIDLVNDGKSTFEEIFNEVSSISFKNIEKKKKEPLDFSLKAKNDFFALSKHTRYFFALFDLRKVDEESFLLSCHYIIDKETKKKKAISLKTTPFIYIFVSIDEIKDNIDGFICAKNVDDAKLHRKEYNFIDEQNEVISFIQKNKLVSDTQFRVNGRLNKKLA